MMKILKFAKKSWYVILAIIVLLFVQANCELSLPEYTSDIIDVGISKKGIETVVPTVIRNSSMEKLKYFLSEDSKSIVEQCFTLIEKDSLSAEEQNSYIKKYPSLANEGIYLLEKSKYKELEKDKRENFENDLGLAEAMTAMMESNEDAAVQMRAGLLQQMGLDESQVTDIFQVIAMIPQEAIAQMTGKISENMSETVIASTASAYLSEEYKAIGMNVDNIQMNYLKSTGLKMAGIALLGMAVSIIVALLASRVAAGVGRDIRAKVFERVVAFSNSEKEKFSTASLITRCTNDIQQIQMVLVMLLRMLALAPIMGIGGIIKVLKTGPSMTWIIFVAVLAILALVGILMIVAMPKFKIMQELVDKLNLVAREILTGIPVIRAFSREKHEEERFDGANRDLMKTQLFTNRVMTLMMPTMMFIMNGISVLIVWVAAGKIDAGLIEVGDMTAFITYTMQIIMSFLFITMMSVMIPRASVAANRIDEVLKCEVVIHDPKEPKQLEEHTKGVVRFEDVSFRYPNAEENVLSHIDFTANPGETTAIIGSSGCGKSTLLHLIPRLFDVTEGKITIDGVDVRDLTLHDLREQIGFVPQKGMLFSGDIESNLKYGGDNITDAKMEEAAEIAQATEFIMTKPDKYQTPIAQGGTNVSGGQKQRLSIARAIAKEPQIYIFDDSFSALDYKTDTALRRALHEKVSDATVLIVAQRISTILHAEKIIVLDEGKIAGIGTHEELLANNEVYRQIVASQLSKEELEGKANGKEEA